MIILDTSVISEAMRPHPHPRVIAWLDAQWAEDLYLASVVAAELWAGIALLHQGAKRDSLESSMDALLHRLFGKRTLDFDRNAARCFADIARRTTKAGTPIGMTDALIAAMAQATGFSIACRDAAAFMAAGVEVVNPWASGA
jgi:predicted nucleic acid-binding protein